MNTDFFGDSDDDTIDLKIQTQLDDIVENTDFSRSVELNYKKKPVKTTKYDKSSIKLFVVDLYNADVGVIKKRITEEINALTLDTQFGFAFVLKNEVYVLNYVFQVYKHEVALIIDTITIFISEYIGSVSSLSQDQYGTIIQQLLELFNVGFPLFQKSTLSPIDICFYERK